MEQKTEESKNTSIININRSHGFTSSSSECGYCKKTGSTTCGFTAEKMKVVDYRRLLDRGFRRCGSYYYQPDLFKSCCSWFTIRSVATEHKMRNSHKKTWKRWQQFLKGERDINGVSYKIKGGKGNKKGKGGNPEVAKKLNEWLNQKIEEIKQVINSALFLKEGATFEIKSDLSHTLKWSKNFCKKGKDGYSSNALKTIFGQNNQNLSLKLFDFMTHELGGVKVKEILGETATIDSQNVQVELTKKGNIILRVNSAPVSVEDNNMDEEAAPKPKPRIFRTEIVEADVTEENFKLYYKYVCGIHKDKDPPTKDSYEGFLCTKNLTFEEKESTKENCSKKMRLGCFHMNYYVDDVLMAVGVIDLLDNGLSTVYFFYDPDYKPLQFGVVSALYELQWIREQSKDFPEFKYYYLGYYIHDCNKMNYKADYEPIELLCPRTLEYIKLSPELKKQVENEKRINLSDDKAKRNPARFFSDEEKKKKIGILTSCKIDIHGQIVPFFRLNEGILEQILKHFTELFEAMGPVILKEMIWKL